jgi:O-Antigen ligase
VLAVALWSAFRIAPGAPLWIRALYFVIAGQAVLNYGFANLMLKFGGAPLPLTEIVLGVALVACFLRAGPSADQVSIPLGLWAVALWVTFNLAIHIPAGLSRFGVGAARDALPTVEILFIIPGYVSTIVGLRGREPGRAWMWRFVYAVAVLAGFYGLLLPAADYLQELSPEVPSVQQSVPLLGYFASWPAVGLMGVFGTFLWRWQLERLATGRERAIAAVIAISGLAAFVQAQSRISYLFVGISVPILLLIGGQGRLISRVFIAVGAVMVALLALELSNVQIGGRIGTLSASGIAEHLMTLSGDSDSGEYGGAAAGINQRREWRHHALRLWSSSPETEVLGIGFGEVLTNLTTAGAQGQTMVVREPHNSYVSILTRSGLLGIGVFLSLQTAAFITAWRGYRRFMVSNRTAAAFFLGALLAQTYSLMNAWGEPHFENAYTAVPSLFLIGCIFGVAAYYRQSEHALRGADAPGEVSGLGMKAAA